MTRGPREWQPRLDAADQAERVLPIYERQYPADDRPRKAVEAARAYDRGDIDATALTRAATDAARAAADAAADFADALAISVWVIGDARVVLAAWAAARAATWAALPDATTAGVLGYVLESVFKHADSFLSGLAIYASCLANAAADVADTTSNDIERQDKMDRLGRSCIEGAIGI